MGSKSRQLEDWQEVNYWLRAAQEAIGKAAEATSRVMPVKMADGMMVQHRTIGRHIVRCEAEAERRGLRHPKNIEDFPYWERVFSYPGVLLRPVRVRHCDRGAS